MSDDLTMEELADGLALWEEHKPQSGEDWVAVAERCLADPVGLGPSPIFAGLLLAVEQRDKLNAALVEAHRQLTRYEFKGPKQIGRALLTMERALGIEQEQPG